jgi:hypothetical protein
MRKIIIFSILGIIVLALSGFIFVHLEHKNQSVSFSYDEKDHALLIKNGESGLYIRKIVLDLHQDTLSVNVYKKLIFPKPTRIINSAGTRWKIKLMPNVKFVTLGNVVTPLSEMRRYPPEYLESYCPVIEDYPKKFPCVVE